jgi:class 3 adenylate cyclase/tetratricopeptide (TPR) repeat protein
MSDQYDRSERRQLTVLFCDVVDSTGLSERCDPEDLREALLEFQALSTRCIDAAGGKVVNYIGDGIRAEFGYPLASEHGPENAVRAGLELLLGVAQLSVPTAGTAVEAVRVRIGIHTGLAIVGKAAVGHVHDATEIVGDTPNIAFRLQEMGEPNSLIISGETEHLLRGKFQLVSLGIHSLRGLSREIQVFRVLGEASEDDIVRRARNRNLAPLVNRAAELDQLLQSWELVKAGHGQAAQITGEAGIGKSRLALELIECVGLPDSSIFSLQASPHHQNVPLYPITRQLEQRIGLRADDTIEANIARLQNFLAERPSYDEEQLSLIGQLLGLSMPALRTLAGLDAQELRRRTREQLVTLLTFHAHGCPGLLLVEDLHWADPSTKEIVERVAGKISGVPLFLLITSRTDVIRSADRSRTIRGVPLQRLDDDQCRDLASSVIQGRQVPVELLQRIVARSDGVPLFVEELAAAASETGKVDSGRHSGSGIDAYDDVNVPSALHDSLMMRLDCLGEAKNVALIASVIGRSFSHRLLAAVAAHGEPTLETALARLIDSGLIRFDRNDAEPTYSFKHALVRDVAYYSLLKRQRRELHARVSDAIESRFSELASAEPDYLAQHLSEAGIIPRAVQMWLKAASRSAERSANLEAVAQLRSALEQINKLPTGSERDDLELSVQIARIGPTIATRGYAAPEVAEASQRALELCRDLQDDPRIFPALYARWSYSRVAGNVREACGLAQDFLALAEQKSMRVGRMVGHRLLGTSLFLAGEITRARDHLETATELYDPAVDQATAVTYGTDVQVTSLCNLCIAYWHLGHVTAAMAHGRRAMELALALQNVNTLGYAFTHVCLLHTLERDVQTVEALAKQVLVAATERELPFWMTVARIFLGWCQIQSGRTAGGIETLERQSDALEKAHLIFWRPTYLCWLGEAYARAGKVTEAKICLDQAREIIAWGGESWYEAECWRIEAMLFEHEQTDDRMQAKLEHALALCRQRGQRSFALRAAADLAGYLGRRGQLGEARKVLEEAMQPFTSESERGDRAHAKAVLSSLG